MQKLLVLAALLAIAYMGMRLLSSRAQPKTVRSNRDPNSKRLETTQLKYDEKSGAYVPDEE